MTPGLEHGGSNWRFGGQQPWRGKEGGPQTPASCASGRMFPGGQDVKNGTKKGPSTQQEQSQKLAKNLNGRFSKENVQTANRHVKGCQRRSSRGKGKPRPQRDAMHIHRTAIITETEDNKCWRGSGESGTPGRCCWNVKCCSCRGTQDGGSSKN